MNPVLKRTLTGLAVGAAVICAVLYAPPAAIEPAIACLAVLAVAEFGCLLHRKCTGEMGKGVFWLCGVPYLAGAAVIACGLWALARIPQLYGDAMCGPFRLGNLMLLYVVAVVKFSDVGGFAFGLTSAKLMKGGNHKLCPTVSPNKSWEGLFGSVFASCLVSCCFMGATQFGVAKSLACGVTAALVGTAGDLVESKFKRWVGVKDSSALKITNGMGGILDMLDSLLIAPAVLTAIFVFWK
ncbi:MAG: phosphatidate cytidylyltransferase [Kiritimatiellae bacterium]|nr:phosphatidate cytidylyltransferase [Kiritimatiellia bacterium]